MFRSHRFNGQAWNTLMSLDSQAVEILQDCHRLPFDVETSIFQQSNKSPLNAERVAEELDLKNDSIHNPSAYVTRAVSNAIKAP